jgi:hypothetical protein
MMKGPWHGGGPGPDPGIHGASVPGSALFIGQGDNNVNWLEISNFEPALENGIYRFTDSTGHKIQLTISCDSGPCPQFAPLPQIIQNGPQGVVFFRTTH